MPTKDDNILGTARVIGATVAVAASTGKPAAESGDGIASADRQEYIQQQQQQQQKRQQQHHQESTTCINMSRVLLQPTAAASKGGHHTLPPSIAKSEPEQGISSAAPATLGYPTLFDEVVVEQRPTPNQLRSTTPDVHGDIGHGACSKPPVPSQQPSSMRGPEVRQGRTKEGMCYVQGAAVVGLDALAPSRAKGQSQTEVGFRGGCGRGDRGAGAGSGSGNGSGNGSGERPVHGNDGGEVCLTEERVAAVKCYLRGDDPICIRRNLKWLEAGTLVQLRIGDTVVVARRCRGGDNSVGGPGTVASILPNFFYDIKYAAGGVEKSVDACFVDKTNLLLEQRSRMRRGGTPRCPDCHSFLHECTCVEFLDAAAMATTETPAVPTRERSGAWYRPSSSPLSQPQQSSRSLKRPRSAMGKDAELTRDEDGTSRKVAVGGFKHGTNCDKSPPNHAKEQGSHQRASEGEKGGEETMDTMVVEGGIPEHGGMRSRDGRGKSADGEREIFRPPVGKARDAYCVREGEQAGSGNGLVPFERGDDRRLGNGALGDVEPTAGTGNVLGATEVRSWSSRLGLGSDRSPEGEEEAAKTRIPGDWTLSRQREMREDGHQRERQVRVESAPPDGVNPTATKFLDSEVKTAEDKGEEDDNHDVNEEEDDEEEHMGLTKSEMGVRGRSGPRERDPTSPKHDINGKDSSNDVRGLGTEPVETGVDFLDRGRDSIVDGIGGVNQATGNEDIASGEGGVSSSSNDAAVSMGLRVGDDRQDSSQPYLESEAQPSILEWQPRKGDLVEVERRMTPGVNKPGGTARVVKVDSSNGVVDVRYIVEGGWERGIDPTCVRPAMLDLSETKRPTLGRCRHCGSLRIDCRQGCDFYTAPPPPPSPPRVQLTPPLRSHFPEEALRGTSPSRGLAAMDKGQTAETSRKGKGRNHRTSGRHRRHVRQRLGGEGDHEERGLHGDDIRGRRRRHLPDDSDEEGMPVPDDEEEEEEEGGRGKRGRDGQGGSSSESPSVGPRRRRRRGRRWIESGSDESDVSPRRYGHGVNETQSGSDSDIGLLGVRRSHHNNYRTRGAQRGTRSGYSSGSSGSSSSSSSSSSITVGTSDSIRDSDGGNDSVESRGPVSPLRRAGRRQRRREDVQSGDESGTARFLMPEGEDESRMLPSDIPDPTRGVKDPVVLRKELKRLLEQMEQYDAKELEHDVPAVCRRVASATAENNDTGILKVDLQELLERVKGTLRCLDVANNIFVRLEKLEARWSEGVDGENAWHRLDRISVSLEQLRRDAEKNIRDFAAAGVDDSLSSSGHDSGSNASSRAGGSSCGDFDLGPISYGRHQAAKAAAVQGRRREERAGGRHSKSTSSKRSGTARERRDSGRGRRSRGDSTPSKTRPREGRTGRKRSGQPSSSERGRRRGSADGRDWDRMEKGDGESENEAPYLLGLDYSMAAESQEADDGALGRRGSSLSSSSARSPSPTVSSSQSLSSLPLSSPGSAGVSRRGGGRDRGGSSRGRDGRGRSRSGGAAHRRRSEAQSGQHARGRSGGNGGSRNGGGDGGRGIHRLDGIRRSRYHDGRISGWAATTRRGGGSSLGEQNGGNAMNGRALAESIFQQRLAEQEARGGPQPYGSGAAADAAGERAESAYPAAVHQTQVGRAHPSGEVGLEQAEDRRQRGGQSREGGGPSKPPRLVSLVKNLLAQPPLRRPLSFNTLYSRTSTATAVQVDDLTLEVGGVDPCLVVELGQGRGVHDAWDAITGGRQPTMKPCLAGAADGQPRIDSNSGDGKDGGIFLDNDERRGRQDGRVLVEGDGDGDGGRGEGGGEEEAGSSGGELVRMLELLPQRMADLEELALADGLDDEAEILANDCCQVMSVVGDNLRTLFSCNGRRRWRARSLAAVKDVVEHLAEACAPGRGLGVDISGSGGGANSRRFPAGLSLTTAVELREKKMLTSRGSVSVGSASLLAEACAAMHVHLLQWLAVVTSAGEDADGRRGAADASGGSVLLDFARRLLVDLLFLLEKQLLPAIGGSRRAGAGRDATYLVPALLAEVSRDPLTELLSAVMDTLDGTIGPETVAPAPAMTVTIAGLTRPLVGFWGVFFEVISGGPSASSGGGGGGGGNSGGACSNSWNAALPSELVWKALVHAFHLGLLRRGWGDTAVVRSSNGITVASGSGNAPEEPPAGGSVATLAVAGAHRRKETSKAFWQCVRLLLAASPFAVEFCGGGGGGGGGGGAVPGQPAAVTATAEATAAALAQPRQKRGIGAGNKAEVAAPRTAAAAGGGVLPAPPIEATAESLDAPGMVARVLLERVLVLARFCAPEAGPQGVVEKLWVGVQRLSTTLCVGAASSRVGTLQGRGEDQGGGVDAGGGGDDGASSRVGAWEREERRNRSARRLGRRSHVASAPTDLGRLLAAAVESWCLPTHGLCRLPRAVLEGGGDGGGERRSPHGEGDYQALCSLTSQLTQEHAMRLPEGLKRRRLANGLLKAKYSPPQGSAEARLDQDDVHALAPSRVLLGIALGLAQAGLVPDAAKELVKAAAVRPRNVTPDTPRDRSIALVAPAAAALCLALPVSDCVGSGGLRGKLFGVLAGCMRDAVELMARVLDGASRLGQAVNLERLERPRAAIGLAASCILLALRHLGPLSQQPPPGTFTCSAVDRGTNDGGGGSDSSGNNSTIDARRAAVTAAAEAGEAFVEVLGRALERRFSDHLGRAALTTIMSALVHCWPRSLYGSCSGDGARGQSTGVQQDSRSAPTTVGVAQVPRGYAMGWGNLEPDGSLGGRTRNRTTSATLPAAQVLSRREAPLPPAVRENGSGTAAVVTSILENDVVSGVGRAGAGARTDGGTIQPEVEGEEEEEADQELRDEYGSWDGFADDADLDALLTGGTPSQSQTGAVLAQQAKEEEEEKERRRCAADKAAAAAVAATAAAKEEEDITWRYLAESAQTHVLPHLPEILKKTWTMARYAQGTSSSSSYAAPRFAAAAAADPEAATFSASRPPRLMMGSARGLAGSSSTGASGLAATSVGGSHGGSGYLAPSSRPSSPLVADSEVDASVVLELHASAALLSLRRSIDGVNGDSSSHGSEVRQQGRGAGRSSGSSSGGGGGYRVVRDRYLDLHRMSHNSSSLVPQQRLLAPAFFCLALDRACGHGLSDEPDKDNRSNLVSQLQQQGARGSSGGVVCDEEQGEEATTGDGTVRQSPDVNDGRVVSMLLPKPTPPLLEALRGREWDMLHLWMQAALDPLTFPVRQRGGREDDRRRSSSHARDSGGPQRRPGGGGSNKPSDLVRERFEVFTRCLSAAFGPEGLGVGSRRRDREVGDLEERAAAPSLDASVAGVFEKRLTRLDPAQLAALSLDEAKVLERVLDAQSVVAHCGALWASILGTSGPVSVREGDRKRVKENVVKLAHSSIKSLRRFLPEVFPRTEEKDASTSHGHNASGSAKSTDKGAASRPVGRLPSRYSSAFRRLYGHAAYAVAAYLMRMCGGALKGLPLRELVETCFEGVACRPLVAGSRGGGGGSGGSAPNAELTEMAVMHASDLLHCFSEIPMTVPPVTEWMKNINDHAINGDPSSPSTLSTPTPLISSLAAGLRGDLHYPSRPPTPPRHAHNPSAAATFVELASAAALAPPPRPDPTAVSKRLARMRLEVLGDRKLRVARFLMEVVNSGRRAGGGGEEGEKRGVQRVSISKVRRLLVLLTETFRCRSRRRLPRHGLPAVPGVEEAPRAPEATTTAAATMTHGDRRTPLAALDESRAVDLSSVSPRNAHPSLPPRYAPTLTLLRDVLPLIRPVYSLLGEALLGEPGPARRLGRQALAAAVALSTAGLDAVSAARAAETPSVTGGGLERGRGRVREGVVEVAGGWQAAQVVVEGEEFVAELRVAECFADTVVLALSTKLDTFLMAMGADGCGGGVGLADLGPRESELEGLLAKMGAWEGHGKATGWPHHMLFPTASSIVVSAGGEGSEDDTALPALLEEAEEMVAAFQSLDGGGGQGSDGGVMVVFRRVEEVLVPRIEACRMLLSGSSG